MRIQVTYEIPDGTYHIHSTLDYVYEKDGVREWRTQEKFTKDIEVVEEDWGAKYNELAELYAKKCIELRNLKEQK